MNIFVINNYRQLLRETVLEKKGKFGRAFTFEKLASACRLQRNYLSTVLGGRGHLNSDQLYMACVFLGLTGEAYTYVALLHERERSIVSERCAALDREIESMRLAALQTEGYVASVPLVSRNEQDLIDFYLDLNAQLVHMFLTVKRFRTDPDRICAALNLAPNVFRELLAKIERIGLITINGKLIEVVRTDFHLPATSNLYPTYRMQMRLKAMEHMQTRPKDDHYSFSVVYSANEDSRNKIRARFLEFINWAQALTQNEDPQHVYQLNFDLLKWG